MDLTKERSAVFVSASLYFPVQFLVDELNRVGKGREDLTELQERWNQAVALELAFFDIGYEL